MTLRAHAHCIRRRVLQMASGKGQGYVGQGLGIADVYAAVYFGWLRFDPACPDWSERDRFILSIGHYSLAHFAALGELGLYSDAELATYGADGSRITMSTVDSVPGVEVTGGSLGQGLCVAAGLALGARMAGVSRRTVCLLSDGELQEGATWEAAMFAGHHRLAGLVALVDVNRTQADGALERVLEVEPVADKWRAFGWWDADVDGNDPDAVRAALDESDTIAERPKVIVCRTRLGAGVPMIMERERAHFVRVGDDEWSAAMVQLEESKP